ncbi:MAG: septum formation initiator family protein [Deltaproteobacteria bacterium]|nr:septum formation initiator family protein [Deltaproteobacteria bacterium]
MKHLVSGFLLLLIIYFSWLTWFGNRGSRGLKMVEDEIVRTREHIRRLKLDNQRLVHQIRLLQGDPRYQELVVRRELQMIRDNEILFVFRDAPDTLRGPEKKE